MKVTERERLHGTAELPLPLAGEGWGEGGTPCAPSPPSPLPLAWERGVLLREGGNRSGFEVDAWSAFRFRAVIRSL